MEEVKKRSVKPTKQTVKGNDLLSKLIGSEKKELVGINGVKIRADLVDALNVFNNKDLLAIILEEALTSIDVVKTSNDYQKKMISGNNGTSE
jgi:hypothetical protein